MSELTKIKDSVVIKKGFPSWDVFENFVIDHNSPVVTAQLLVGAMDEVAKEAAIYSFLLARNYPNKALEDLKLSL